MKFVRQLGRARRQFIRENRRSPLLRYLAARASNYLKTWYNEDFYEFGANGEAFALERFATWWKDCPLVVWDVGAHLGDWAVEAHSKLPRARIFCFEIVEPIHQQLARRLAAESWATTVNSGLSETHGAVAVGWNQAADTTNSIHPRLEHPLFAERDLVNLTAQTTTGDRFSSVHGPPAILKIDVEGHELQVLRGCQTLLSGPDAPAMIQFEYGDTYIPNNNNLRAVYSLLTPLGYSIGRLYPNHVEFKSYAYADDNFRMGNYIAVQDSALRSILT